MRVIGYVRVSTEEQSREGSSLDAQEGRIRRYAELLDLDLVEVIRDEGVSAKTLIRPGIERALRALFTGEAEGLLVAKLDRLTRSLKDWTFLVENYFGGGINCQLMSVADSIDTRTAAGRMILNLLMTVAQWEREAIAERTAEVVAYRRLMGQRIGQIPYGCALGADGVSMVHDPAERAVIVEILNLHELGFSLRAIADHLTMRKVPTKSGRAWSHSSVAGIIAREKGEATHEAA